MEENNSFYIVLPSDTSSREFIHTNKITKYQTRLPERLKFNSRQWEVSLTDFSYKHTWSNVTEGTFEVTKTNESTGVVTTYSPYVRIGRYESLHDLIDEIKKALTYHDVNEKTLKLGDLINFYYEELSDKCYAIIRDIPNHKIKIKLNPNLSLLMGFEERIEISSGLHRGKFSTDLRRGFTSMYVYCDLVEPRLVGSVRAPLLRTVPITSVKNELKMNEFLNLQYNPVKAVDTDVITMDIRQDNGENVPFEGGKVNATLHFRRIGHR